MPRLIVESGTDPGTIYPLEKAVSSMGRSVSNTLQIIDRRMSRNHAEVHRNGSRLVLHDLGSKNGTLLNGEQVHGHIELNNGDLITLGDTVLRVEIESLPGAPQRRSDDSTDYGKKKSTTADMHTQAGIRLIEEKQWGSTKGQRRAGYDEGALESTSILDLKQPTRRLQIIYQVTDAIRSVFDLDELLDKIITIIQSVIRPDRTYLMLVNPETGTLDPTVVKVREGEDSHEIKVSSSIVNQCFKDGVSLLVSDAKMDERFNTSESIIMNAIRTAMVAPLIFKGESIGVIYVDTQSRASAFTEEELEVLTAIANQAAVAITNARLQSQLVEQHKVAREMEIARSIQMNLLPQMYPDLPGYQISAMSLPAKQVGGDYYDFLALPDGRTALACADVSGKGVPAAILTAITRSYLQSESQNTNLNTAQTVERLNRMVGKDVTNDMYVTMVYSVLDTSTGALEFVNAGHAHPFIIHPNGNMEFLKTGGIFLGIDSSAPFESETVEVPPGGVLVLYTDGVTDIMDPRGQTFGNDKFYQIVMEKRHATAEEIRNSVYQACLEHRSSAEQFDDFTLIVLKRLDFNESEID